MRLGFPQLHGIAQLGQTLDQLGRHARFVALIVVVCAQFDTARSG